MKNEKMKNVDNIKNKIYQLLIDCGFLELDIKGEKVFKYNEDFIKFSYISSFDSFVLEYADGEDEALKNRYEDSDLYPLSLGEEKLLKLLKDDLIRDYL